MIKNFNLLLCDFLMKAKKQKKLIIFKNSKAKIEESFIKQLP